MGIKLAVGKLLKVNLKVCYIYKISYFCVRLWGEDLMANEHIFMDLGTDIEDIIYVKN